MAFPLPIPDGLRRDLAPGSTVLVAASGGVDSSVALALLSALGCECLAVTFKNFCHGEGPEPERACCSREAIEDAARVARLCGARHWVTDVSQLFRREVIEPFVAEYRAGRTPNPCLECNARVRFPHLVRLADQLGCARVATGHYARVAANGRGPRLLRGRDPRKDQSYFLYRLERGFLPRIVFPLGWYTKDEVRRAAVELGLGVADKRESQEICFVPAGDRGFLFADGPGPGEIVDGEGRVLGTHRGLEHYTVGQRRGLGIAAAEPYYVVGLDRARNRLLVGPEAALAVRRIVCDRCLGLGDAADGARAGGGPDGAEPAGNLLARIRYRHAGTPVASWRRDRELLDVVLAEPARGVAPGQSLVLYRGDEVLGGGRILRGSKHA